MREIDAINRRVGYNNPLLSKKTNNNEVTKSFSVVLDEESNYQASVNQDNLESIKVSDSLEDIFTRAAIRYDLDVNFLKSIGKAESNFRTDAVSKSGAQGVMQLMPATAKYLGVNDSFDPEENIMGGAKYIKELLDKYNGDKSLALAAYNAGMNNVAKYGGIPPFNETQNYVKNVFKYMGEEINLNQNIDYGNRSILEAVEISNDNIYTVKAIAAYTQGKESIGEINASL